MLSPSAFNALLKTLEEPPSHVIFILATTELQKLPSTIISRCQRYDFRRLSMKNLVDRMQEISAAEGIDLKESGALMIARMAQGGMRDAISLLELCAGSGGTIDENTAAEILGADNKNAVYNLVRSVSAKDYNAIYAKISELVAESRDLTVFWQDLIDTYRDIMVVKTSRDACEYLDLTENEYKMLCELSSLFSMETLVYHSKLLEDALYAMQRVGFTKRSTAEITLTRMCDTRLASSNEALLARIGKLEEEIARLKMGVSLPIESAKIEQVTDEEIAARNIIDEPIAKKIADAPIQAAVEAPSAKPRAEEKPVKTAVDDGAYRLLPYWNELTETIAERKPSVAGFLAKTKAYFSVQKGFMIQVASDFVAGIINRPEILVDIKSMLSEYEDRNILNEPFEILSVGKTKTYQLIDELESAIDS